MPDAAPGARIDAREPLAGNYFVSTYPPFSGWDREGAEAFRRALDTPPGLSAAVPLGLYVHVPFCAKRCRYCHYLSYEDRPDRISPYLDSVAAEVRRYAGMPAVAGRPVSFVYFGGGTPSLLSRARLRRLLDGVRSGLPWDATREVTFECAPASVTRDKMRLLRDSGVTRVSLGAQQLDDAVLEANGRVHLVRDVERAYAAIRAVGFDVVNIDLMVGLVGETDRTFFSSLDRVIGLEPESVTIYQLEIPRNTPLFAAMRDGELRSAPPGWAEKRERLVEGYARLAEAGHTWRSAYTAVRDPSRHAFVYQDEQYAGADLIGVGASSFGFLAGVHHQNLAALETYVEAVSRGGLPLWRGHRLSREESLVREAVLQLKLGRLDLARLDAKFGAGVTRRFDEPLAGFETDGLLVRDNRTVTLTRAGLARVDHMIPDFYLERHRGVRYS